jgi:hypothetical protein
VIAPLAIGCCLGAAAVYTAVDDPSDGGPYLPCPFRTLTGWWCPVCGSTRATHHLLRGELVTALRYQMFVPILLAAIVAAWSAWMLTSVGRPTRFRLAPRQQATVLVVLTVFGVVRNLPGVAWLRG